MRTRTVCGVSRGDAPLTLRWLKDGEPLPLSLGVNVTSLDQYSSLLSIPSLSASHSGDYTCVATNPAAEVKFTASLMVKGNVCLSLSCPSDPSSIISTYVPINKSPTILPTPHITPKPLWKRKPRGQ